MKSTKKIFACIMCAFIVLGITSCDKDDNDNNNVNVPADIQKSLPGTYADKMLINNVKADSMHVNIASGKITFNLPLDTLVKLSVTDKKSQAEAISSIKSNTCTTSYTFQSFSTDSVLTMALMPGYYNFTYKISGKDITETATIESATAYFNAKKKTISMNLNISALRNGGNVVSNFKKMNIQLNNAEKKISK